MMQDIWLTQIFEETCQIQKMIISDHLLGRRSGKGLTEARQAIGRSCT